MVWAVLALSEVTAFFFHLAAAFYQLVQALSH